MKVTLQTVAVGTALGMSAFAGVLATTGLATFIPGAKEAVFVMGGLFEVGQLVAFAYCHRHWATMGAGLKYGLSMLACVVVVLDVVGVSGQLSQSYQGRVTAAMATNAEVTSAVAAKISQVEAEIAGIERQVVAVDQAIAKAGEARIKAKGDRDYVRAAKAAASEAEAKREKLAAQWSETTARLTTLKTEAGQAQRKAINGSAEFAAVKFVAGSLGWSEDAVARLVIFVVSSLPNLFAVGLVMAAGHGPVKVAAPEKKIPTKRQLASKKGWETRRRKAAQKRGPKLVHVT